LLIHGPYTNKAAPVNRLIERFPVAGARTIARLLQGAELLAVDHPVPASHAAAAAKPTRIRITFARRATAKENWPTRSTMVSRACGDDWFGVSPLPPKKRFHFSANNRE
jgi:hypothetical protein